MIKPELFPIRDRIIKLVNELADGKPGRFAKKAGVHNTVIENVFADISLPTLGNLAKICLFAGVSADFMIFGKESKPAFQAVISFPGHPREIPHTCQPEHYEAVPLVAGLVGAGYQGAVPWDYIEHFIYIHETEIGRRQDHGLQAIRLAPQADSMTPTIRPGDIVVVDPEERPPQRPLSKKAIYAVRLDDEGNAALKRVREVENHWICLSDNLDYNPILIKKSEMPNLIIGKVIWSWTSWVR